MGRLKNPIIPKPLGDCMEIVVSFDLFDTLISRIVPRPEDVFYFLGIDLRRKGILNISPAEFQKYRIRAEQLARKKSKHDEVTIAEIYEEFGRLMEVENKKLEIIKLMELELENRFTFPIAENVKKIGDGDRVIVVSDSYLPREFIEGLLKKNNLKCYELFVSSEHRASKVSGRLYKIVAKKYKIVEHRGDNLYSDVKVPSKLGIAAIHYSSAQLTRYEKLVYNWKSVPFEIRSIIAGAMRATRLTYHYDDLHYQKVHEIASNVAAPFLFSYVFWVLYMAKKLGIKRLYFLSRDGQILIKVANILKTKLELFKDIETQYLYVSRRSLYIPAIGSLGENDFTSLCWLIEKDFLTLDELSRYFSINEKDILELKLPDVLNINELNKYPALRKKILSVAKEEREILLEYLKQVGFVSEEKIGLVDVGWKGRLQSALYRILYSAKIHNELIGFYVGLVSQNIENGKKFEFLHSKRHLFFAEMYETFTSADHGSCTGYKKVDNKIFPVLKEEKNKEMIEWGLYVQQRSVEKFSDYASELFSKYISISEETVDSLRKIVCKLLENFVYSPAKEDVEVFTMLKHKPDPLHEKYLPLVCRHSSTLEGIVLSFLPYFLRKKLMTDPNKVAWVEGANCITYPVPLAFVLNYTRKNLIKIKNLAFSAETYLKRFFKKLKC